MAWAAKVIATLSVITPVDPKHEKIWQVVNDDSVIEAGMMFSVEHGLYDSENGIGVNPSDILFVQEDGAVFMTLRPLDA